MTTDYRMMHTDKIVRVHRYTTVVTDCFTVWETKWNPEGNRFSEWGPFEDLVAFLEDINVMDNKIAVEYINGLYIGFYDGKVNIGTGVYHPLGCVASAIEREEIEKRLDGKRWRRNKSVV